MQRCWLVCRIAIANLKQKLQSGTLLRSPTEMRMTLGGHNLENLEYTGSSHERPEQERVSRLCVRPLMTLKICNDIMISYRGDELSCSALDPGRASHAGTCTRTCTCERFNLEIDKDATYPMCFSVSSILAQCCRRVDLVLRTFLDRATWMFAQETFFVGCVNKIVAATARHCLRHSRLQKVCGQTSR